MKNYFILKIPTTKTTFIVVSIKYTFLEDGSHQHKTNDTEMGEIRIIDPKTTKTDKTIKIDQIMAIIMRHKHISEPEPKIL